MVGRDGDQPLAEVEFGREEAVVFPAKNQPDPSFVAERQQELGGLVWVQKILSVFAETTGGGHGKMTVGQSLVQRREDTRLFQERGSLYRHAPGVIAEMVSLRIDES